MPANTAPIFAVTPLALGVGITAANTSSQGGGTIGTDIFLAATAGAFGAFISKVRFMPTASVASTALAATVARIFVSTQASGATTSSNTHLIAEVSLPAVTADLPTTGITAIDVPLNIAIPAGATILVTNHAAPNANTQYKATCFAGSY